MSKDLNLLNSEFRSTVGEVLSACFALGIELRPYNTLRNPWEQARYWRQSRSIEEITAAIRLLEQKGAPFLAKVLRAVGPQFGERVTNALPGASWHQWGEAMDCFWFFNGQAEWSIRKRVSISDYRMINGYALYAEEAAKRGLTSGGLWTNLRDWPHLQKYREEVVDCYSWPEIDQAMQAKFGTVEPASELAAASMAVPVAEAGPMAFEVAAVEDNFVRVEGDKFRHNGKEFKFIGFNVRGLVHYGAQYQAGAGFRNQSIFKNDEVCQKQLELAYSLGARLIRVFLPHQNATPQEVADRFDKLLSLIEQQFRDLYVIPALVNLYGDVEFKIRGTEGFYHPNLTPDFFREGYKKEGGYLNFVQYIVNKFKGKPNIFAWEIGNELKVDGDPRLLIAFMHHVARVIRDVDPNHLVTTGMISTAHAHMFTQDIELRKQLYAAPRNPAMGDQRKMFDFVTIHYPREGHPTGHNYDDINLAQDLEIPFIIEESTVPHQHKLDDRSPRFKADMDEWFGRGASGYMVWGFDGADVGDGDPQGVGGREHADWPPLRNLFQTYAGKLA